MVWWLSDRFWAVSHVSLGLGFIFFLFNIFHFVLTCSATYTNLSSAGKNVRVPMIKDHSRTFTHLTSNQLTHQLTNCWADHPGLCHPSWGSSSVATSNIFFPGSTPAVRIPKQRVLPKGSVSHRHHKTAQTPTITTAERPRSPRGVTGVKRFARNYCHDEDPNGPISEKLFSRVAVEFKGFRSLESCGLRVISMFDELARCFMFLVGFCHSFFVVFPWDYTKSAKIAPAPRHREPLRSLRSRPRARAEGSRWPKVRSCAAAQLGMGSAAVLSQRVWEKEGGFTV